MGKIHLNDLKDSFAEAYFFAIAAAANISIERTTRKTDNKGIDLSAYKGKKDDLGSQINVQLKGVSDNSSTMIIEEENHIKYNYHSPCQPTLIHYLIVVILPTDENPDKWLRLTKDELILKRCAYYFRLIPNMKSGFITIPKAQLLTHESIHTLFPDPLKFAELI